MNVRIISSAVLSLLVVALLAVGWVWYSERPLAKEKDPKVGFVAAPMEEAKQQVAQTENSQRTGDPIGSSVDQFEAFTREYIADVAKARFNNIGVVCPIELFFKDHPRCAGEGTFKVLLIGDSVSIDALNFLKAAATNNSNLEFIFAGNLVKCRDVQIGPEGYKSQNTECADKLSALSNSAFIEQLDMVV